MIESFMHKGLEELFDKGKSAKVQASLAERILRRLDAIDAAKTPEALNIPGFVFILCRANRSDIACMQMVRGVSPLHGKVSMHCESIWKTIIRRLYEDTQTYSSRRDLA